MRVIVQRVSEAAAIKVRLVNDGPVTLAIDSRKPE
jgi:D-Tyr-tRNAtyr deacylase